MDDNRDAEFRRPNKILRGFSMVDQEIVSKLHEDIKSKGQEKHEIACYNFTLPDLSQFDDDFAAFLMKDLVENATLKSLEETGHLNWWTKESCLQRLYPLLTCGDGNCLLHAASLGIWGIHDRWLNLRQDVHQMLLSSCFQDTLKLRWLWYVWVKNLQEGLNFNEEEWEAEWKAVLDRANSEPVTTKRLATVNEGDAAATVNEGDDLENSGFSKRVSNSWQPHYESLEEVHIFSLAHVLRRPIIVVADSWVYDFEGRPLAPIPFAGIYLPIEYEPAECCRSPLVLAFCSSHFSPIVATVPSKLRANENGVCTSSNDTSSESDSSSKSQNGHSRTASSTNSVIQNAMFSLYDMTKSTLHAAKSFISPPIKDINAGIPIVNKDLDILSLPFAVKPDMNWNYLDSESSENIVSKKSLSEEERLALVKKYLDVVEIDLNRTKLRETDSSHPNATETKSNANGDSTPNNGETPQKIPVVVVPCENQPTFYDEVMSRYLKNAKERFDFEEKTRVITPQQPERLKCMSEGCDLYGTVENSYLCSNCYKNQFESLVNLTKSSNSSLTPPSYAEATGELSTNIMGQSSNSSGNETPKTLKEISAQCPTSGCEFFGSPNTNGFCSKCFKDKNSQK